MPKAEWLDNNLAALLSGRKKKSEKSDSTTVNTDEQSPLKTPVNVPSSEREIGAIIQPVTIPEPSKKRKSFPVYGPEDLLQRFSSAVAADGRKKSPLIITWIEEYLKQREQYDN